MRVEVRREDGFTMFVKPEMVAALEEQGFYQVNIEPEAEEPEGEEIGE